MEIDIINENEESLDTNNESEVIDLSESEVKAVTQFGKIQEAFFGHDSKEPMFGLNLLFSGRWGSVAWRIGCWSPSLVPVTEEMKWTEEDRQKNMIDICLKLDSILVEAKVRNVTELIGVPVVLEFEGNTLKNWRILSEVL